MHKNTKHHLTSIFLFMLVLNSGCQTISPPQTEIIDTPPVSKATATSSPIPIPTPSIPPTLEPAPNITPPTFEGFKRVELLPDNFFIAYQKPPGNIYDSLTIGGSGGGEEEKCSATPLVRINPKTISFGIGGPGVLELCHFPLNEDVTITLTRPNGKVETTSIYNDYKETRFCLPGTSVLESGKYKLEATSLGWAKAKLNFTIKPPKSIQVFFPKTYVSVSGDNYFCEGEFNSDEPTAIYFRGLKPNETRQLLLYRESGFDSSYSTTWKITADSNGNVVEYIADPILDNNTSMSYYRIIEFDPNINFDQVPFYYTGEGGLNFRIVNSQIPTPTPHFLVDSATPLESKWIQIPAGSFLMGASKNDPLADPSEKPQHYLSPQDFWIQDVEVTNANYSKCVESKICTLPQSYNSRTRSEYYGNPKYANYPVIYVNYDQAKQYCESIGGRLPTEAEWEKAAREFFPDNEVYPWYGASKPNEDIANFGNIWHDTLWVYWGYYVGYGNHPRNMAGNVWEWVEDWYLAYPGTDLKGDKNYGEKFRVIRGGSFASDPKFLRISNRFYKDPKDASDSVGFRCVRDTAP